MAKAECNDCPIMELKKIHSAIERKVLRKMPPEVREPLLEVRHQLLLAFRGFIQYNSREEDMTRNHTAKSRPIGLE